MDIRKRRIFLTAMTGGGSGISPYYQAVLDYATSQGYTLPSESQQALQATLIYDLKADGSWDKAEAIYVPATDGDIDFANINWKNPGGTTLTRTNSVISWTADQGYKGVAGSTNYLSTGINARTPVATKGIVIYNTSRGISTSLRTFYGTTSSNYKGFTNPNTTLNVRIAQASQAIFATQNSNTEKFMYFGRSGDDITCVFDDNIATVSAPTSTTYPDAAISILGSPSASQGTDDTVGFIYIGGGLPTEHPELRTSIENYINNL